MIMIMSMYMPARYHHKHDVMHCLTCTGMLLTTVSDSNNTIILSNEIVSVE